MSSGTSAVRSRFFRMSQNMWNKSVCLWNQNCYMRTNTGRRGLDHGQLSSNIKGLHSPLAIFCQLSGLGQWLCGDSKGKTAELAYLILAEWVSTSKNTDRTASQCAHYLQDHPNEVIAEKKSSTAVSEKKAGWKEHGHNIHLADTLSIKKGCSTPVTNGEAGHAPSVFLSAWHICAKGTQLSSLLLNRRISGHFSWQSDIQKFKKILTVSHID